jgi:hypothetical protein
VTLSAALVLSAQIRVAAEPIDPHNIPLLTPQDALRVGFRFEPNPWEGVFPPVQTEDFDVFEFSIGVNEIAPIGSFTASLFDRGQLLGTYTSGFPMDPSITPFPPALVALARFRSSTSLYRVGDPTVVDFSSIHDATFDGYIEFTIATGLARLNGVSDDVAFGRALGPALYTGPSVSGTYEFIRGGGRRPCLSLVR